MTSRSSLKSWKALQSHAAELSDTSLRDLFEGDGERFERFSFSLGDMVLDASKNRITTDTLDHLVNLARETDVEGWRERMIGGEAVNNTENRAALHMALRDPEGGPYTVEGVNVTAQVNAMLDKMAGFCEGVRDGDWTGATGKPVSDIVNIGIGGSDLGPAMVCEALDPWRKPGLGVHFVSNVDGTHLSQTVKDLNPETTLFVVVSKTFTTQETLKNAASAKAWLVGHLDDDAPSRHMVAVSANAAAVADFGIDTENMFEMWDWVGGRFSICSAVGLSIALSIGMERYRELLAGSKAMDDHFRTAPLAQNMPVLLALIGLWNINFLGINAHAVLPYDQSLSQFPAFIQQLDMESNGKSVTRSGEAVDYPTAPVIIGEAGTNGQHSFYQQLHQGMRMFSADFIAAAQTMAPLNAHHDALISNFLAQTESLMLGRTEDEARAEMADAGLDGEALEQLLPHRVFEGNRPTTSIMVKRFDPFTMGMLVALYEHKIFVQGVLWDVNSFDQWGVELGKKLAGRILPELENPELANDDADLDHDASTNGLIRTYRNMRDGDA